METSKIKLRRVTYKGKLHISFLFQICENEKVFTILALKQPNS